jgi:uncharacterized protein (DUF486 family)
MSAVLLQVAATFLMFFAWFGGLNEVNILLKLFNQNIR